MAMQHFPSRTTPDTSFILWKKISGVIQNAQQVETKRPVKIDRNQDKTPGKYQRSLKRTAVGRQDPLTANSRQYSFSGSLQRGEYRHCHRHWRWGGGGSGKEFRRGTTPPTLKGADCRGAHRQDAYLILYLFTRRWSVLRLIPNALAVFPIFH